MRSDYVSISKIKRADVLSVLKSAGFDVIRIKGSHHFLRHPDGRVTVVPLHGSETIGPGLLMKILRDVEMDRAEFLKRWRRS